MDHLADHIFHFKGEGVIKDYNDSFSQLIEDEKEEEAKAKKVNSKNSEESKRVEAIVQEAAKLSFDERKEYNRLEKEIEKLELKKEEINAKLYDGGQESDELTVLTNEFSDLEKQIEQKSERWLDLADRA